MSGYDRDLVVDVNDKQLDEVICGICHGVFKNPVTTECCQQTYCEQCINEWVDKKENCPNDRKRLTKDQLKPVPRSFKNLINGFSIKCSNVMIGCDVITTIGELDSHLMVCHFKPNTDCKVCGHKREVGVRHNCVNALKRKIVAQDIEISDMNRSNAKLVEKITSIVDKDRNNQLKIKEMQTRLMSEYESLMGHNQDDLKQVLALAKDKSSDKSDIVINKESIFENARNNIEKYEVTHRRKVDDQLLNFIVDSCKRLLKEKNKCEPIANELVKCLKAHYRCWNGTVLVFKSDDFHGTITMRSESYLRLKFMDINIVVIRI